MNTFNSILDEIQKNEDIGTVAAFADKINISAAQLSRIKKNKAPLTANVINKIYEYFAKNDKKYADNLKERLELIKSESSQSAMSETKFSGNKNSAFDEYGKLIEKMSRGNNLLMVEYRDFPVTLKLFRQRVGITVEAIKNGLCLAMFQPFGSRVALYKKHNFFAKESSKIKDPHLYQNADEVVNSYDYLIRLAGEVNQIYEGVKKELNSEEKGQIVLYEAAYKEGSKYSGALPSIVAGGIVSKLYYAHFQEPNRSQTKIYEWIAAQNDDFFFIERSNTSLNFNAVKMQFNPIPAYWEKNKKLPETQAQLNQAYEEFGFLKLFGEEEAIKWGISSPN